MICPTADNEGDTPKNVPVSLPLPRYRRVVPVRTSTRMTRNASTMDT
jgi:hypothetical protein